MSFTKPRMKAVLTVAALALGVQQAAVAGTPIGVSLTAQLQNLNLEPPNLGDFIKDKKAALILGKALFWDMGTGSDGIQACASCHFAAGADNRSKNQLSPGVNRAHQDATPNPDITFDLGGPNHQLTAGDFPTYQLSDPTDRYSTVLRNSNDIVSSQGIKSKLFVNAIPGFPVELTKYLADPTGFQVNGTNVRRVEPRNTPSVVNAVLNYRNFWDGRAQNDFNGVNPFGSRDPNAFVYKVNSDGKLEKTRISLINSSLASQSVGPPQSIFEMSAVGRPFAKIGVKLLPQSPLFRQKVARDDSVLGSLSRFPNPGLKIDSYLDLVKAAFQETWYNGDQYVRVNADGSIDILSRRQGIASKLAGENTYTQAEYNFSMFFGLAIQVYEATLVSDQTRFDRYLDGDTTALTDQEQYGFKLFGNNTISDDGPARCSNCHGGPETTDASIFKVSQAPSTGVIKGGVGPLRRRGLGTIGVNNIIDLGFNNIGVSATLEDLGVGGDDPFGNPLSVARKEGLLLAQGPDYPTVRIPDPNDPTKTIPFIKSSDVNGVDGAFKIPMLRNIELTAPYFHNGSAKTLDEVLDHYIRGGNFQSAPLGAITPSSSNLPDYPAGSPQNTGAYLSYDFTRQNAVKVAPLGTLGGVNFDNIPAQNANANGFYHGGPLTETDKQAIIALLRAMTDDRVKYRKAPFDAPQLFVPNGEYGDENSVIDVFGYALDEFIEVPMTGANGGPQLPLFLDIQQ